MIVGSQLNAPGRQPHLLEQLRLADGGVTARWGMANDSAGHWRPWCERCQYARLARRPWATSPNELVSLSAGRAAAEMYRAACVWPLARLRLRPGDRRRVLRRRNRAPSSSAPADSVRP